MAADLLMKVESMELSLGPASEFDAAQATYADAAAPHHPATANAGRNSYKSLQLQALCF